MRQTAGSIFRAKLRERRKELNLTQTGLANHGGFYQQDISKYERGESEPSLENLAKLAVALGVSLDWLLGLSFDDQIVIKELPVNTILFTLGDEGNRPICYLITDKPENGEYIDSAWSYAVRETADRLEPRYDVAIEWLEKHYPNWQFLRLKSPFPVYFNRKSKSHEQYEPPS